MEKIVNANSLKQTDTLVHSRLQSLKPVILSAIVFINK